MLSVCVQYSPVTYISLPGHTLLAQASTHSLQTVSTQGPPAPPRGLNSQVRCWILRSSQLCKAQKSVPHCAAHRASMVCLLSVHRTSLWQEPRMRAVHATWGCVFHQPFLIQTTPEYNQPKIQSGHALLLAVFDLIPQTTHAFQLA